MLSHKLIEKNLMLLHLSFTRGFFDDWKLGEKLLLCNVALMWSSKSNIWLRLSKLTSNIWLLFMFNFNSFKNKYQYCAQEMRLKFSIWKINKKYWKNQSRTNIDIFSQISILARTIEKNQS
jgi:hypothetical protein